MKEKKILILHDDEKKRSEQAVEDLRTVNLRESVSSTALNGLGKKISVYSIYSNLQRLLILPANTRFINRRLRALDRRLDKRDDLLKSPERLEAFLSKLIRLARYPVSPRSLFSWRLMN